MPHEIFVIETCVNFIVSPFVYFKFVVFEMYKL